MHIIVQFFDRFLRRDDYQEIEKTGTERVTVFNSYRHPQKKTLSHL